MFILVEGRLDVIEDGVHLATISEPGSYVGELAYLTGSSRLAEVRAASGGRVRVVEDVDAFFREQPARALEIARLLASRLYQMDRKFLEIRQRLVDAGGEVPGEKRSAAEDLEFVRRYVKGWRVNI
jgi:CRP-like cAMP-binding protein